MLVSAILLVLAVIAVAAPHQGMIDLPGYHDVGVLFKEGDFKGESKFLIEKKGTSECLPIALGPDQSPIGVEIGSFQICVPTACTLFTGDNCAETTGENFAITTYGPYDASAVELPDGIKPVFKTYMCGEACKNISANVVNEAQAENGHVVSKNP